MSDLPLISVVVPTFNHEAFVERSLRSVAEQTYVGPIELVVIDDASTDRTFERAQECVEAIRRTRDWHSITVRRSPTNRGAHATLTDGLARARGELLTILNSDDEFVPERLATIVHAMTHERSEFGFSLTEAVDADGRTIPFDAIAWRIGEFAVASAVGLPSIEFGFLRHQLAVSTGNMIFTRRLYDRVGGFSPLRYVHDWDFALGATLLTHPCFVQRPLYRYRIHDANSFASLGHVAELESEVVLKRYFARILTGQGENELAATPRNWPFVFEHYLARFGSIGFWNQVTSTRPRYADR